MTRRLPRALAPVVLLSAIGVSVASVAGAGTTAVLAVTVQVHARTSIQVSTRLLEFNVVDPAIPAVASLEFTAASRTYRDGEVVLLIEPERWIEGPGGAADVEGVVAFAGEGAGTASGELMPATPATAGRWIGSGRRSGRLSFTLRAGARGHYRLPVRLVITAP